MQHRSNAIADVVHDQFHAFLDRFGAITRRAREHFATRDWNGSERDALERLGLYGCCVDELIDRLRREVGSGLEQHSAWAGAKRAYAARLGAGPNRELGETFFNSTTRRVFSTAGVDPTMEFCSPEPLDLEAAPAPATYTSLPCAPGLAHLVRSMLERAPLAVDFRDLDRDCALAEQRLRHVLPDLAGASGVDVLTPVFYRVKHAYVIGRVRCGERHVPLILALLHEPGGAFLDAVLVDEAQASILFSFTRAYFHAAVEQPLETIRFLRSILPRKPAAELYMSLGFHKHGKTEMYRGLLRHLRRSSDCFEIARGDRGLVMIVFALPNYDMVFKVIRDRFPFPKTTSAQQVRERYRIVFERDRVGRLVEAQEFEHLVFARDRFDAELLAELTAEAHRSVRLDGDDVLFDHVYLERKVRPLNLFLKDASSAEVEGAVVDYGHAIRELAAANIFPGDFLLKNFGLTRHGRVVFYDYDELCLLTDCSFKQLPAARTPEDELSAEPWFGVADNDIFPEEFGRFLGLPEHLLRLFERHHAELLSARFWRELQRRHRAGEILDFYPYPASERLHAS